MVDDLEKKIKDNKNDINLFNNKYLNEDLFKYYDIVIDINSLENLQINGWKIYATERGYEKYIRKDKSDILVSVLGNKNTGKSFILSKISNIEIPDGFNISTKGLSIIYPDNDENIIFLDTLGLEDILCEDDGFFKFGTNNEEYFKLKDEEKKLVSIKDYINEDEYTTQIKKFTRDKQLTNEFIKKFVIYYSNINIYVVDYLKIDLKEQNIYKYFLENKINIIIHNLKTFKEIIEVEEYIKYYLLKSVPFKLKKNKFTIEENEKVNNIYYNQIFDFEENDKKLKIFHLFMANDKSEAGSYYNESTIKFIKEIIKTNFNFVNFPIIEKVKEFLFEHSEEFFNDLLKNKDDLKIIEENKKKFLKYTGEPFELKDCYIDELENTNIIQSNYIPYYRVYKAKYKDENGEEKKLFIDLEISGVINKLELPHIDVKNKETILTITGIRNINIKNFEQEAIRTIFNFNNNNNKFKLKINIPNEKCKIKNLYKRIIYADKGLYRFIYDILE